MLAIVSKAEAAAWLEQSGRPDEGEVALSEVKDDLSKNLRLAEKEAVVIARHGRAAESQRIARRKRASILCRTCKPAVM
jgi:hypothetical protein